MHSVRRFTLVSTLAVMTLFYTITAYWNYSETLNHISRLFDDQLIDTNILLQNISPELLETLLSETQTSHSVDHAYQVWTTQGELLSHSSDTGTLPLTNHQPGLMAYTIGDRTWHTFTVVHPEEDRVYITAQRGDLRNELAHQLASRHIFPFLITFPMVAIAFWLLISHGFKPLNSMTRQINDRQFDNLSPIPVDTLPIEIAPTVEAMNALFNRLNSAYEREQRFAADAAHELRTPLAAVRTMAQLAMGTKDPKSVQEYLGDVLIGVDRCTHAVKQLAILNSLRPEEIMKEITRVNLNQVVHQIARELQPLAEQKKISFDFSMPAATYLKANLASIQILMRNLIDNAIRYSPEGSKISLRTQTTPKETVISVSDQGPGIPPSLRDRVFERFYRELGTGQSGSGLGLSIVATICQLHGAKIELGEGDRAQGLTVTLRFPTIS